MQTKTASTMVADAVLAYLFNDGMLRKYRRQMLGEPVFLLAVGHIGDPGSCRNILGESFSITIEALPDTDFSF
jgi:hypothetical protein